VVGEGDNDPGQNTLFMLGPRKIGAILGRRPAAA
jgi:hypothetical protein